MNQGQADLFPKRELQLLFVEDNPADFKLALVELRRAGLEVIAEVVATPEEFLNRLYAKKYDAIIADYRLKGWTGMHALELVKQTGEDIPFLLVTGALGDTAAVDCIKRGVGNYVLKNNLSRFPVALCRALEEKSRRDERRRGEILLQESEAKFRLLADTIPAAVLIYEGAECRYANHAAELLTGFEREELLAKSFLDVVHPDSRMVWFEKGLPWLSEQQLAGKHEIKILGKGGIVKFIEITVVRFEAAAYRNVLVTAFDITDRKIMEDSIRLQVAIDPLTGLGNYRQLMDVVRTEMERSQRAGRPFSLVLLDLDELKKINDTLGHLTGSRALCRVADVLRLGSRAIDTAVRYGGDEFALVLPETNTDGAREVAERIAEQVMGDHMEPLISVSFGTASFPADGESFEDIFRAADDALYRMKAQSKHQRSHADARL